MYLYLCLPFSLQAITPQSLVLMKGFLSLSFIASAFYVVNDLFDIENDRNHHSKKNRTFALGKLSIPTGFLIFSLIVGSPLSLLTCQMLLKHAYCYMQYQHLFIRNT